MECILRRVWPKHDFLMHVLLIGTYNVLIGVTLGAFLNLTTQTTPFVACKVANVTGVNCYEHRWKMLPLWMGPAFVLPLYSPVLDGVKRSVNKIVSGTEPYAGSFFLINANNKFCTFRNFWAAFNSIAVFCLVLATDMNQSSGCFNETPTKYPNTASKIMQIFLYQGVVYSGLVIFDLLVVPFTHVLEILGLWTISIAMLPVKEAVVYAESNKLCDPKVQALTVFIYFVLQQGLVLAYLTQILRSFDMCLYRPSGVLASKPSEQVDDIESADKLKEPLV